VFQLELSRNLLFLRGTTMDEAYQKLIDRTRKPLDLKQVKTNFGFSYRPHQKAKRGRKQSEIFKAVEAPSYDLTVFKIKWRNLTLKIYDKGGRVLRIEVVVHNAKELRVFKRSNDTWHQTIGRHRSQQSPQPPRCRRSHCAFHKARWLHGRTVGRIRPEAFR
jgi:hypothetical protein